MPAATRRIQFRFTGGFLFLLLLAAGCFAVAYLLYQQQTRPPIPPPYYVNRTTTSIRPCYQCLLADGRLKELFEWSTGKAVDIPAGEQWWFAPVEENPVLQRIDGVPMLAVHPTLQKDKPWQGFDQRKVFLAVFQDLDGRFIIEHSPPPAVPCTPPAALPVPSASPVTAIQPAPQ